MSDIFCYVENGVIILVSALSTPQYLALGSNRQKVLEKTASSWTSLSPF